jgi:hypothetical protein
VVSNWLVETENILTNRLMSQITLGKTDTLNNTLGKQRMCAVTNVDYLILNRRTSAV